MLRARVVVVAVAILAVLAGCSSSDDPPQSQSAPSPQPARPTPERPDRLVRTGPPVRLTVMQYNIQFADAGINVVARDNAAYDPDVVLINEIDDRRSTGGLLQAEYLAERLGMSFAYDPNGQVRYGIRGNAVLTRHDITYVRRYNVPTPEGTEKRGLMNVVVRYGKVQLDLWTTHLNPDVGTLEQARRVRTIIGTPTCSTVMSGDLNTRPYRNPPHVLREHLGDLWRYVGDGVGGTNSTGTRRIDYMYFRNVEPVSVEVGPRGHSDHRPLVGTFLVDPRKNC